MKYFAYERNAKCPSYCRHSIYKPEGESMRVESKDITCYSRQQKDIALKAISEKGWICVSNKRSEINERVVHLVAIRIFLDKSDKF